MYEIKDMIKTKIQDIQQMYCVLVFTEGKAEILRKKEERQGKVSCFV